MTWLPARFRRPVDDHATPTVHVVSLIYSASLASQKSSNSSIMRFASLLPLSAFTLFVAGTPIRTPSDLAAEDSINGIMRVLDRVSTGIIKTDAEVKLWLDDYNGSFRILEAARWVHQDMYAFPA